MNIINNAKEQYNMLSGTVLIAHITTNIDSAITKSGLLIFI